MNKVIMIGRLVRDPELRYTSSGTPVCNLRIAVRKNYQTKEGEPDADFFNVVVWNGQAEATAKYMGKGRQIAICGRLQIRESENDGKKYYNTEIVANEVEFLDGNGSNGNDSSNGGNTGNNSGGNPATYEDDDVPF